MSDERDYKKYAKPFKDIQRSLREPLISNKCGFCFGLGRYNDIKGDVKKCHVCKGTGRY